MACVGGSVSTDGWGAMCADGYEGGRAARSRRAVRWFNNLKHRQKISKRDILQDTIVFRVKNKGSFQLILPKKNSLI
jgi:hypothetical protein